jgi:DNA repair protein RadC
MEVKSCRKTRLNHFETSQELAEIKVVYKNRQKNRIKISSSKDAFNVLYPLYDEDTIEYVEQFFLLLLNRANIVLGWVKLSSGGTAGTVVDQKIIFGIALKTNASSIIISHNHPSSNLTPSNQDITLTDRILKSGKLMEIQLIDHLIISPDKRYYSFADEGNLG